MNSPNDSENDQQTTMNQLDVSIWYRRVYALCQAKLISRTDAEDATQETFIRGISRLDKLRSADALGAWLRGIASNVCVDIIRRNKVRETVNEPVETIAASEFTANDDTEQLVEFVGQLPEPLREVVLLHYYENMTYDQMADWLGVARSTVNDRLGRARSILKKKLFADRSTP